MRVRTIIDEDFTNYKEASMLIGSCFCDWKCCVEQEIDKSVCHNFEIHNTPIVEIPNEIIIERYVGNPITSAIIIGGLEPFMQFEEVYTLLTKMRNKNIRDYFIIYTGYTEKECLLNRWLQTLSKYHNVVIKFGRFIPNQKPHFDETLGVMLASENQYSKKIS